MTDQLILAVEDTVDVPVKFTMKVRSVNKLFSFTVTCDRMDQEQINECMEDGKQKVTDFMRGVMRGWSGQRLVLDAAGNPVEFSEAARDMMLKAAGVGTVLFNAYLTETGAKPKN